MERIVLYLALVFSFLILSSVSFAQSISDISLLGLKLDTKEKKLEEKLKNMTQSYSVGSRVEKFGAGEHIYYSANNYSFDDENRSKGMTFQSILVGILSNHKIFVIERREKFSEGKYISLNAMLKELISRYGKKPGDAGDNRYLWVYDSNGNYIDAHNAIYTECATFEYRYVFPYNIPTSSANCPYVIKALFNTLPDNKDVVKEYRIIMINPVSRMNDYQNLIQKKKDDDRKNAEGKIGNF
jgi:hypothetical protein